MWIALKNVCMLLFIITVCCSNQFLLSQLDHTTSLRTTIKIITMQSQWIANSVNECDQADSYIFYSLHYHFKKYFILLQKYWQECSLKITILVIYILFSWFYRHLRLNYAYDHGKVRICCLPLVSIWSIMIL